MRETSKNQMEVPEYDGVTVASFLEWIYAPKFNEEVMKKLRTSAEPGEFIAQKQFDVKKFSPGIFTAHFLENDYIFLKWKSNWTENLVGKKHELIGTLLFGKWTVLFFSCRCLLMSVPYKYQIFIRSTEDGSPLSTEGSSRRLQRVPSEESHQRECCGGLGSGWGIWQPKAQGQGSQDHRQSNSLCQLLPIIL